MGSTSKQKTVTLACTGPVSIVAKGVDLPHGGHRVWHTDTNDLAQPGDDVTLVVTYNEPVKD